MNKISSEDVEIISFSPQFADDFRRLNEAWLLEFLTLEQEDQHVLSNPFETIINPGGHILLAKIDDHIVGTCALTKVNDTEFELVKMSVADNLRGKQIGKKLGLSILQLATKIGAKKVRLETHRSLIPAIKLYEKLGFRKVTWCSDSTCADRCDVKMEIDITPN